MNDREAERRHNQQEIRDCGLCDHYGWRIIGTVDGSDRVGRCLHRGPDAQDVGYETVPRTNPNDPVVSGDIKGYEKIGPRFPIGTIDFNEPRNTQPHHD